MPGNHIAVFIQLKNADDRKFLAERLATDCVVVDYNARLLEITGGFDVRWVLGI